MHYRLISGLVVLFLAGGAGNAAAQADPAAPVASREAGIRPAVADLREAEKARAALDELIRAYEVGNVALIRNRLDPAMIGYQRFLDGVVQDSNMFKQIRVHLKDTQVLAGPDVAVIRTNWEKRFLSAAGFVPDLYTGHSMFLLHRDKAGWRMAAFGGDNLFASQGGVLGQLGLAPGLDGIRFEVLDPDMAGQMTLTVKAVTSGGVFPITLTATSPGRFFALVAPVSIDALSGTLVTLQYLDQNPGGGRPPSLLSKSILAP